MARPPTIRAVLDNNTLDVLADDREALQLVERSMAAGLLLIIATPILKQEMDGAPVEKWVRLEPLRARLSNLDVGINKMMPWSSLDDVVALTSGGNDKHWNDAMQTLTAHLQGAYFITEDERATKRARSVGMQVASVAELARMLHSRLFDIV